MPLPIRAIHQQFDPRRLPNLALWLDSVDSSTHTLNGSTVSEWRDKSGNGRHATQSTAASQPGRTNAGIGGLQTMNFSGSSFMDVSLAVTQPATIVAVARLDSGTSYQRILSGDPDVHYFFGTLNGNFATFFGNGTSWNDVNANTPSRSVTSSRILTVVADSGTATPYVSGEVQNTKTSTGVSSTTTTIGKSTGTQPQFWNGQIGDIIVYSRALSSSELRWLHIGLSQRWSIALA